MSTEDNLNNKTSIELIVYQISEVKNLVTTLTATVMSNQDKIDKRVSSLEMWRAGEEERSKNEPKFDVQKIVLAAFGCVSAAIALAMGLVQAGIVK